MYYLIILTLFYLDFLKILTELLTHNLPNRTNMFALLLQQSSIFQNLQVSGESSRLHATQNPSITQYAAMCLFL